MPDSAKYQQVKPNRQMGNKEACHSLCHNDEDRDRDTKGERQG